MKNIIILFIVLSSCLFAQRKTFLEGEVENGGFGAPSVKFSPIKNEFGVLAGGYGGWLINHSFFLGGGGYGLANNIKAKADVQQHMNLSYQPYIGFGYGGLIMEYYHNPESLFHSSFSLLVGGGALSYREGSLGDEKDLNDSHYTDAFWVIEPGLSAEVNVTSFMKTGFSLSYRYIWGVDTYGIKNSDLSGISGGISLKFGKF